MNNLHVKFGFGKIIVDTGDYDGKPAVFIAPAKVGGEIGGKLNPEDIQPKDALVDDEIVFTFPTKEQAERVSKALINMAD